MTRRPSPSPPDSPRSGARGALGPPGALAARSQAAAGGPPPGWEASLARLEERIEQFRIDSERYFHGGLELPPEDLRDRIQRQLRELRLVPARAAVEQFRLGSLEARFNSLSELFGRRLRDREEGRGPQRPRTATVARPRHDARAGIVFDGPSMEGEAVAALYGSLVADGNSRLELETFRAYLAKQLLEIRGRAGTNAVQFRVVREGEKLKLKAKPLARPEGE
jgi:hypothetical protein